MLLEPPLDPSGDEARSLLRRELLHPEYHQDNLVLRLVNWLSRLLDRGLTEARELPPLTTFAAMLVGLLLLGALGWLVSRARRVQRESSQGRVLRYVVTATAKGVTAKLVAVPASSSMGAATGTRNIISFVSRRYRDEPIVISGPGAGAAVTAAGILNDICALAGR